MIELSETGFYIHYEYMKDVNDSNYCFSIHYNPKRDVWACTLSCGPIFMASCVEPSDPEAISKWLDHHSYSFMTPNLHKRVREVIDEIILKFTELNEFNADA